MQAVFPKILLRAFTTDPTFKLEVPRSLHRHITTRPSFAPPPARRLLIPAPQPTVPPSTSQKAASDTAPPRRPTNRQIQFSHVYVLDPTTQKLSDRKHSLEDLLATHTRAPHRGVVELLASAPRPVVRVTTRAEIEAQYKAAKRALKQGARVGGDAPKEVQLTWGVARGDVEHKLRKAARDLDKGYRVVVAVAVKHRRRPSSQQELVAFADEIAEVLREAGEECEERAITNRSMVLSFRKTAVP